MFKWYVFFLVCIIMERELVEVLQMWNMWDMEFLKEVVLGHSCTLFSPSISIWRIPLHYLLIVTLIYSLHIKGLKINYISHHISKPWGFPLWNLYRHQPQKSHDVMWIASFVIRCTPSKHEWTHSSHTQPDRHYLAFLKFHPRARGGRGKGSADQRGLQFWLAKQNGGKKACCDSFVCRMHLNLRTHAHKLAQNTVDKVFKQTLIVNLSLAFGYWSVHFPDLSSLPFFL